MLVLSETKLKGTGEKNFGNVVGRVSGVNENERAREGVGIIVGEAWKGCVREWKEVSSRLMYVRMQVGVDNYVTQSKSLKAKKGTPPWMNGLPKY